MKLFHGQNQICLAQHLCIRLASFVGSEIDAVLAQYLLSGLLDAMADERTDAGGADLDVTTFQCLGQ
ncbi:hypothetical protein NS274_10665 [Pseudomonas oryzihabitans]|nr:hypothetical protein NS274_10665 [Pseudomonas psychrotolerans]KTT04848.1 hypothetical protein NS376_02320 [Pseudomonas psychrotolerans]KTT26314.1 hypothetical protein SB14R_03890 [Pseudomonas psychrotolerans]KTT39209.1 hypothetical protein SB5_13535 [Pseudomonas psychrotolerans]KTT46955.1 hypothetical protein RSA46_01085 [Pseudomonas psychrotolerans]